MHSKIFINLGYIFLLSLCQKPRYYVILASQDHLNCFSVFTALVELYILLKYVYGQRHEYNAHFG